MKCLKCNGTGFDFKGTECDACAGTGTIKPFLPETKKNSDNHNYGQDNVGEGE